jgi:hypothetical protein
MYIFINSGPLIGMKRKEYAAATALTTWVFPQPVGPYKSMFDRSLTGAPAKNFGNFSGNSIVCNEDE